MPEWVFSLIMILGFVPVFIAGLSLKFLGGFTYIIFGGFYVLLSWIRFRRTDVDLLNKISWLLFPTIPTFVAVWLVRLINPGPSYVFEYGAILTTSVFLYFVGILISTYLKRYTYIGLLLLYGALSLSSIYLRLEIGYWGK